MASLDTNPELLLRAFVETVKDLFPTNASAFLKDLRNRALVGTAATAGEVLDHMQDWSSSNLQHEGASTQWIRELSAGLIAQLCQAALDILAAEAAAGGSIPGGNLRFADFSGTHSTLGG